MMHIDFPEIMEESEVELKPSEKIREHQPKLPMTP